MRKAEFVTELDVVEIDDERWRLDENLCYYSPLLGRMVTVPKGFVTDFASVPRLPFAYAIFGGRANKPAVVHDFLYHNHQICSREMADRVFREAMEADGHSWFVRTFMWAGVRLFGGKPYEDDEPLRENS